MDTTQQQARYELAIETIAAIIKRLSHPAESDSPIQAGSAITRHSSLSAQPAPTGLSQPIAGEVAR